MFIRELAYGVVAACVALAVNAQSDYTRPNDHFTNSTQPSNYGCGSDCQYIVDEAIVLDRTEIYGSIPFTASFYATSTKFTSTSQPGDLLKIEPYINISTAWSNLPGGTTLFRIQYVSLGENNDPVPATAFLALPFARPLHNKSVPLVAFAHGTIGYTQGCAPSTSFNLYDYDTWKPLFLQGYAILATDYAGLGNNYTAHHWNAPTLQANDVYFSAVAAKRAFTNLLSDEWVAVGHSQGGAAVWALAESELVVPERTPCKDVGLRFLGSVPISPSVRLADLAGYIAQQIERGNSDFATSAAEYAAYLYAGLNATTPGSADGLFTDDMVKRVEMGNVLGVCFYGAGALGLDLTLADGPKGVYKNYQTIASYPPLVKFQDVYGAGLGKPALAPMLVVQSTGDKTVAAPVTELAWNTTCAASGKPVHLSLYPALDHSATLGGASPEWLAWVADRFQGRPVEKKCAKAEYAAIDLAAAYLPSDF